MTHTSPDSQHSMPRGTIGRRTRVALLALAVTIVGASCSTGVGQGAAAHGSQRQPSAEVGQHPRGPAEPPTLGHAAGDHAQSAGTDQIDPSQPFGHGEPTPTTTAPVRPPSTEPTRPADPDRRIEPADTPVDRGTCAASTRYATNARGARGPDGEGDSSPSDHRGDGPEERLATFVKVFWTCSPSACGYLTPAAAQEMERLGGGSCASGARIAAKAQLASMGMPASAQRGMYLITFTVAYSRAIDADHVEVPREAIRLSFGSRQAHLPADPSGRSLRLVRLDGVWMIDGTEV